MEIEPIQKWRQFPVGLVANIASFLVGTALGWSSSSLVKLVSDESPVHDLIDADVSGWITSFMSLGAIIGSAVGWNAINQFGRKRSLLLGSGFILVSYIFMFFLVKIWAIYVGRLFQGVGVGIIATTQPLYNVEIATDDFHGAIGSLMTIAQGFGGSYAMTLGTIKSLAYTDIQWMCIPAAVIFIVTFIFMPETPHYHAIKGNHKEGMKSLRLLRGQSENGVLEKYNEIKATVEEAVKNKSSSFNEIRKKENFKGFLISIGLIFTQQLTGINAVFFNMQSTIESTRAIDPFFFMIGTGTLNILMNFVLLFVIDWLGRRKSLLISAGIMALSTLGIGIFFYLMEKGSVDVAQINWLPVAALVIYTQGVHVGYGPMPWIMVNELLPSNVSSLASAGMVTVNWIMSFIVSKLFPLINEVWGISASMLMFSGFSGLAFIYVFFVIFETKGLSLIEIQRKLRGE